MKRYLLRVTTFLVTLVISFVATMAFYSVASVFTSPGKFALKCENFCFLPRIKKALGMNRKGEVEVHFLGFGADPKDGAATLNFQVINNSPEPIYYSGYNNGKNESYRIMLDGKISDPMALCGSGLQSLHLHSGESANLSVFAGWLGGREAARAKELRVGYVYRPESQNNSLIYWSTPIVLPDGVKAGMASNDHSIDGSSISEHDSAATGTPQSSLLSPALR